MRSRFGGPQDTTYTQRAQVCERALYALLAGNLTHLLDSPVTASWEDAVWAVCVAARNARVDVALWQRRQEQKAVTGCVSSCHGSAGRASATAATGSDVTPRLSFPTRPQQVPAQRRGR